MTKPHIKYCSFLHCWFCGVWQPNTNENWKCSSGRTPREAYKRWLKATSKPKNFLQRLLGL